MKIDGNLSRKGGGSGPGSGVWALAPAVSLECWWSLAGSSPPIIAAAAAGLAVARTPVLKASVGVCHGDLYDGGTTRDDRHALRVLVSWFSISNSREAGGAQLTDPRSHVRQRLEPSVAMDRSCLSPETGMLTVMSSISWDHIRPSSSKPGTRFRLSPLVLRSCGLPHGAASRTMPAGAEHTRAPGHVDQQRVAAREGTVGRDRGGTVEHVRTKRDRERRREKRREEKSREEKRSSRSIIAAQMRRTPGGGGKHTTLAHGETLG